MLTATHDSMTDDDAELGGEHDSEKKREAVLQKSAAVKKLVSDYKSDQLSEQGILY